VLRRGRPEDADTLAAVMRSALNDAMPSLPQVHTTDEDLQYIRNDALTAGEVWVAERAGRVVGFTVLGTRGGSEFMEQLHVTPAEQRRGIGTLLMKRAKERRPDGFRLWVFQANIGARQFYERHGFRLVELTDGSGNEEKEPDALYEWLP
jgi:ribosomal protein S18 acetylase RimI-like enzyme